MMSKKFRILSIDAWADIDESWTWNNWFHVETYDSNIHGELNEENAMKFFFNEMFTANSMTRKHGDDFEEFKNIFEIDDDQHNLVLIRKENRMPLYAIEYGNNY